MNVGYVGLGNMGAPMAGRLASQVSQLAVYDRNPAAVAQLTRMGGTAAESLPELAKKSDIVLLCLPTSAHVREVVFGAGGLIEGLQPGSMVIDQTSGDPRETRDMAEALGRLDIDLVDAPVSGGPARGADGTIAVMVGASDAQFERARSVLELVSERIFRAGAVGDGHLVKLVNNMISATIRWATMEGVALAAKMGAAPTTVVDIMSAGGARSDYMEAVYGPAVLNGDLTSGFSVGLAHKDVRLACEIATDSQVPMLLANTVREIYQMGISESGFDTKVDSLALMMDRLAGTSVVPDDHKLS